MKKYKKNIIILLNISYLCRSLISLILEVLKMNNKENYKKAIDQIHASEDLKETAFENCVADVNIPVGEVFTSPVEEDVNGEIYFDYPQNYRGNEARGVHLWIENGKVVKATAEKGEDFLNAMLDMDEGARGIGEIAVGTNDMIQDVTGNILFDEKIGGSIHMAVGASYPETGGKNVSGLHWDLIKNMKNGGQIYADDELIYENGKFNCCDDVEKLYEKIGMIKEVYDNPEDIHFEVGNTLIFSISLTNAETRLWNNKNLFLNSHEEKNKE